MKITKVPYPQTNQFSNLIIDYLANNQKLKPFINHFPSFDAFEQQLAEKKGHTIDRAVLVKTLKKQNVLGELSDKTTVNIDLLLSENTFTVTTGHQLCLFTGPLYSLYKIISAINLAEQLKEKYPNNDFVPVFWMASEDHDFEEVNHVHIFGNKITWESGQSGAVGRMKLENIDAPLNELKSVLGKSTNAEKLFTIFEKAYLGHKNLADATRYLINEIFGQYGIVILDGDDVGLKELFLPIMKKDILQKSFAKTIQDCSSQISDHYKVQAHIRSINFFKLSVGKRELIKVAVSEDEIENYPNRFSPNVLMRPILQESVLPNIAYIGGGAELAYWMQLKTAFEQESIPFPVLVLRNSAMVLSEKQKQDIGDLSFDIEDLFLDEHQLQKNFVLDQKSSIVSLENERQEIRSVFDRILKKTTDDGLKRSVQANLQKQLNQIQKIEKKLIGLEKKKHELVLSKISKLKHQLFPKGNLQERHDCFIPFYLQYGDNFIEILKKSLNPLDANFVVLSH